MFKQTARIIQKHVRLHVHRQLCQKTGHTARPNLKNLHTSTAKTAKNYVDSENKFAHDLLRTLPSSLLQVELAGAQENDFDKFLDRNWRAASASEITQAFQSVLNHSKLHNINLSDRRFDKLVDGLMDNVEHLTTEELATLLTCLPQFPQTESFKSHNFYDVWSALDDACNWKMQEWDVDTIFTFADLWYKLHLGRICRYVSGALKKLGRKPERLTKDQLVHAFFLMNLCRKRSIEFEYEHALESKIAEMTVDELAVVAMGYFKSQCKIKPTSVMMCMIDKVKEECNTIHEIALGAILKIIRFSAPIHNMPDQIYDLLEVLPAQVPRLSQLCCLHIALLGTTTQICHNQSLAVVAQKYVGDAGAIRLKDMERLLLALTMFDFDPKTRPDVFEVARDELRRPERAKERAQFPRCVCSALTYLATKNIYVHELISEVLDAEFINEVFGKASKQVPRELFFMDRCIEIDCPEYEGTRLAPDKLYKAAKWLTEFAPDHNQVQKISAADKLFLSVVDVVQSIVGGKNYSHIEHVLPHFAKPDIILCRDKHTKQFVEPPGFQRYILGDIMRPFNLEATTWYAIVVVGWNLTTKRTFKPMGAITTKERQLKKIGYEPVLVET